MAEEEFVLWLLDQPRIERLQLELVAQGLELPMEQLAQGLELPMEQLAQGLELPMEQLAQGRGLPMGQLVLLTGQLVLPMEQLD
jgi:hypothetical protein